MNVNPSRPHLLLNAAACSSYACSNFHTAPFSVEYSRLTVIMVASPHAHRMNTGTSSDTRVEKAAKHRFRLKTEFFSDFPWLASRWRSTLCCLPTETAVLCCCCRCCCRVRFRRDRRSRCRCSVTCVFRRRSLLGSGDGNRVFRVVGMRCVARRRSIARVRSAMQVVSTRRCQTSIRSCGGSVNLVLGEAVHDVPSTRRKLLL